MFLVMFQHLKESFKTISLASIANHMEDVVSYFENNK